MANYSRLSTLFSKMEIENISKLPVLFSLNNFSSWSIQFEAFLELVDRNLKIPISDGYFQPKLNGVYKNPSRLNKEEKECYDREKKIKNSKDLWIAIANLYTNDLKYHIDELKAEIMRLNKRCDKFDLLKEENVRLKKEIEDLKNKSKLQEKRTDKDLVDISKEVFKSISKPVECQK
ncbi:hypothetical protein E3N88_23734 [Mikania micrantha]|uniref:DUF4219 domain-containing protein n=1 Tax=Mikania micrantha TaxID=192012 RepID=A0A5N6NFV2_9ASTR|nr:hypothetical protein E3N88_23734 [Mikania micrantha]